MARCDVCFRKCELAEGETGACGARIGREGTVQPLYYGQLSSLALDPIEKKPLAHFQDSFSRQPGVQPEMPFLPEP